MEFFLLHILWARVVNNVSISLLFSSFVERSTTDLDLEWRPFTRYSISFAIFLRLCYETHSCELDSLCNSNYNHACKYMYANYLRIQTNVHFPVYVHTCMVEKRNKSFRLCKLEYYNTPSTLHARNSKIHSNLVTFYPKKNNTVWWIANQWSSVISRNTCITYFDGSKGGKNPEYWN